MEAPATLIHGELNGLRKHHTPATPNGSIPSVRISLRRPIEPNEKTPSNPVIPRAVGLVDSLPIPLAHQLENHSEKHSSILRSNGTSSPTTETFRVIKCRLPKKKTRVVSPIKIAETFDGPSRIASTKRLNRS